MRIISRAFWIVGVVSSVTLACAKSEQKTAEKATEPADDGDDGDTEVAQAVPMALLGSDYVAELGQTLGPSVASDEAVELPVDPTKEPLALAKATLKSGARAAGQMKRVLEAMQTVLQGVFGAEGFFRGKDVSFAANVKERRFKQLGADGQPNSYLVVRINDSDQPYRFGVELYPVSAVATLTSQVSVEFSPEQDGQSAEVHFTSSTVLPKGGEQRLDAHFVTEGSTISATFGNLPTSPTVPARTTVRLDYDEATNSVSIAGAYVWDRPGTKTSDTLPRYYTLTTGDIESFAMRSRLASNAEGAQRLAFLPSGAKVSSPYPVLMTAFLIRFVREVALDGDCATVGDTFRAAFNGKTVPPEVAAAPADLCATNSAFTDDQMGSLIAVACAGGTDIPVSGLGVCSLNQENALLKDPQLFYLADGARHLVGASETPMPAHATVTAELGQIADVPLAPLSGAMVELSSRPVTDFAEAEARPE